MTQLPRYLSSLIILFMAMSCGSGNDALLESGVSLELAQWRSSSIKNVAYGLDIKIPQQADGQINGIEVITFELNDLSKPLILDFKAAKEYVKAIEINGEAAHFNFDKEHISIPQNQLSSGTNTLKIEFRVGETSLNRNEDYLYTLFVPDRARTAFPCFDQPNLKGRFSLSLTIPKAWQALANGQLISQNVTDGTKRLSFAETNPLSTYLFDFVVGDFKVVEREVGGRTMMMLHREDDSLKVARNVDAIFELHDKSIKWLESYTGIEYPFQKFGFALIPSFQYGGMEHPGAITYKSSSLFLDESATQNQLMGRASLIAHETSHMWFGDLVTMDWFNDVWMKEVFANFMAAKIVNPSFPEINHDLRFLLAHYPGAYSVDRTAGTHPIQQPLANLKDAGTLYGAIIYQKAPIVMRHLEQRIGEEKMQLGLQQYLSTYKYGNASWDDLIKILNEFAEEPLTRWSDQWVKASSMPEINPYLNTREDSTIKEFSIYQRNRANHDQFWSQKLSILLEADDSVHHFDIDLKSHGFTIDEAKGLRKATFIVCNSDGIGYGYFTIGPLTKKRWLERMEEFTDPVMRGVGWLTLWEGFLHQRVNRDDLMKSILRNLKTEPDPLIQQYLMGLLDEIYWKFTGTAERNLLADTVERQLWQELDSIADPKFKAAYFNVYRSIALTSDALEKLYRLWNKDLIINGLNLSENDYTQLAYQLALKEWPGAEKVLEEQLTRISNTDRKAQLKFMLPALSSDQAVRDAFFESLKDPKNREHESWVQQAIGFLHHPLRAESSEKYITPTLEMLEEIQMTGDIFFPQRVLDNTFSGHQSEAAVDEVRQFLYRHNHYPENLKNKILQASDMTFRAAEMLNEQEKEFNIVL